VNRRAWLLFALVSVLWGIPYLFIKIAIEDLSPLFVVAGRTAIAAAVLVPVAAARGVLPALRRRPGVVVALALLHIVGPFLLITYGELHITSSLTALLIAVEPILIGLLMVRSDPLTPVRVVGLLLGLAGVAALTGLDIGGGDRLGLLGAGMVTLATVGYACATVLVQRGASDIPPTALVAGTQLLSTLLLAPFAAFALPTGSVRTKSWIALLVLGLLCTAVALLAFYGLIGEAGPNRAGLVTYVNPLVAVVLGVIVLSEPLHASTLIGCSLILSGCWLSTRPPRERRVDAGGSGARLRTRRAGSPRLDRAPYHYTRS
jgi:drug/metabolite transporter (DMT)-like permease